MTQAVSAASTDTERLYLSGHGKDDAVPWKFQCTYGTNSGFWTNLAVPSNWDVQGFGTLNYKKDQTNAWGEQGLYEYDFSMPAEWQGRRVFLVFEGVMTDTSAKLNGESAGPTHQGGFYRFKYEVTKLAKFGETNRLEVTVAKHSANMSVNNAERLADYWVFGGIYRPVYLEAVPPQFIERVAIDARHDGRFALEVFTSGITSTDVGMEIEAQIMTLAGEAVGTPFSAKLEQKPALDLQTRITSPLTWTAETPNLYSVEVRLKRGKDVLHRFTQRFGFRTMEVRDGDGLYVNGQRVILKGVNRHSFWPDSGRCLSEDVHRLDIELMKNMNMNAVRMSHYPPDVEFLDICDELGLYVLDELTGWHKHYDTDIGTKLVEEMVTRDVNHPCILFWDNGNEGGFNTNLDTLFGQYDPQQRRVLHPWAPFSGLCTAHYLAYDKAEVAANGQSVYFRENEEYVATNDTAKYIYMPTEMMHGLFDGGGGAGLEDYWKMMTAGPRLGGAFIWTLTDDAVKRPDTGELDTAGNQAPDGMVGPYRELEASYYAIKQVWSPIQVQREADGSFAVENHYSFTDAKQCQFTWQLIRFRDPNEPTAKDVIVRTIPVEPFSVPPGGKGTLKLKKSMVGGRVDAEVLRVSDPTGHELWSWVWPEARAGDLSQLIHTSVSQKTAATENAEALEIKAGDFAVKFSKATGHPIRVARGEQEFSLTNGPRPAAGNATLLSLEATDDGPDYLVTAKYSGGLKRVSWRVFANGWLQCDYQLAATGTNDYFGVVFDYPEPLVKHKRWLGDGPYRVWKNRRCGVTFGAWENDYNNTITGYRDWVYPEFKGCFANVRWLQLETDEGLITIANQGAPFVQVLMPEQPPDNLVAKTKVDLPQCGLGFLFGIPAMGTKFKDATLSGPAGLPNVAEGEYSGTVSVYFGKFQ